MDAAGLVVSFAVGLGGGFGVAWLVRGLSLQASLAALGAKLEERERQAAADRELVARREAELGRTRDELTAAKQALADATARREEERAAAEEKLAVVHDARAQLANEFKALSSSALAQSQQSFLALARATLATEQEAAKGELAKRHVAFEELVRPVKDSLERLDQKVQEVEKTRAGAYHALVEQLRAVTEGQNLVRQEAGNLAKALRTPDVRGLWGEMQLRRVVEMAGMTRHCDFVEQASADTGDGKLRPDVVVKLPGGRSIVVDAKTPLAAYLEAAHAPDEPTRKAFLKDHARQVREKIQQLARKEYWRQFEPTPEIAVLFLPAESFLGAAFEQDPTLVDFAFQNDVVLATPMTLMSLLKAVAYGWKQQAIADNAKEISALGAELFERVANMTEHVTRVGRSLGKTVEHYNAMVGSLEARVLVSARKMKELGAAQGSRDVDPVEPVDALPRQLAIAERALPEAATPGSTTE